MRIYKAKLEFVDQNLKGRLDHDDVARICHLVDFDETKIDSKLASYITNEKYRGLEEFEWQTSKTPADKKAERQERERAADRKRIYKER